MEGICNMQTYYNPPTHTQNIISCSIFPMKKSYRSFDKYIKGLDKVIANFSERLAVDNFKLRIYFDAKLSDIFVTDKYLTNEFLQLVKYECPKFIKDDFHIGLFGTFIRFIPLFKNDENLNVVCITDVDYDDNEINFFAEYYKTFVTSPFFYDFLFINIIGYEYRYPNNFMNKQIGNVALAQVCVRHPIYNLKLMTNFLEDIISGKYQSVVEKLYSKRVDKEQGASLDDSMPIIYGMDEYFINRVLLAKYINDKKRYSLYYES